VWHNFSKVFFLFLAQEALYLPGDNDVGGEYSPMSMTFVNRFYESFPRREDFQLNFLNIKVKDKFWKDKDVETVSKKSGIFYLLVSHLPFVSVSRTT
jgi:hypothetical protein